MIGLRVVAGLFGTFILAALFGVVGLFAGLLLTILGAILMLRQPSSPKADPAPVDTYRARVSIEDAQRRAAWADLNKQQKLQPWQRGEDDEVKA
jgi:hypothetical protein